MIWATAGNHSALHLYSGCHTHPKGWENLQLVLSFRDFSSFLIAYNSDVYFKVEHFLAKLKVSCFLLCCFYRSNIYLLYKKKESEIKSVKSED